VANDTILRGKGPAHYKV